MSIPKNQTTFPYPPLRHYAESAAGFIKSSVPRSVLGHAVPRTNWLQAIDPSATCMEDIADGWAMRICVFVDRAIKEIGGDTVLKRLAATGRKPSTKLLRLATNAWPAASPTLEELNPTDEMTQDDKEDLKTFLASEARPKETRSHDEAPALAKWAWHKLVAYAMEVLEVQDAEGIAEIGRDFRNLVADDVPSAVTRDPKDRDNCIYHWRKDGRSLKWIKDRVTKRKSWEPLHDVRSVSAAAKRFAKRHNLPWPIQR